MNSQPKPSEIIIMVAGVVGLITWFLDWYSSDFGSDAGAFDDVLFPFAAFIGLIGVVMAVQVALSRFANVNFPDRVIGFTWTQIHLVLSIFAGLLALCFLVQSVPGADKAIGLWLGVLSAIGLIVGAVMLHMEGERATAAPSAPPQPF